MFTPHRTRAMKLKVSLVVCTASLFVALPVLAQNNPAPQGHGRHGHGHHNPRGNGSDHSGHHHGGRHGHGRGNNHGNNNNGRGNLVLAGPEVTAAVSQAATSVTTALRFGSLSTPAGAVIAAEAQGNTYALMVANPALSGGPADISAALSTAGPEANAIVPALVTSFSGLASNPAQLPAAVEEYNRFTRAASDAFIANPPPEFLALHTVLSRLTAAARAAK